MARNLDQAARRKLSAQGVARPDGTYPIADQDDLDNAVKDWVRTGRSLAVKSWIEKRARALDLPIPAALTPAKRTDEMDVARTLTGKTGK